MRVIVTVIDHFAFNFNVYEHCLLFIKSMINGHPGQHILQQFYVIISNQRHFVICLFKNTNIE